jgi:hypothetical protein
MHGLSHKGRVRYCAITVSPRREELEKGETHDELWNAAQLEMVHQGKMHGFMRMYWAKKVIVSHRAARALCSCQLVHSRGFHDKQTACSSLKKATYCTHSQQPVILAAQILEWTNTPEEALEIAIWLNDKWEIDGRDPNGYVGCMWSIGGIHDQVCSLPLRLMHSSQCWCGLAAPGSCLTIPDTLLQSIDSS